MNKGMAIFKRMQKAQRLQGGTGEVPNPEVYKRDDLFFRPGHTPSSKESSRLYDPGEYVPPPDDEQGHDDLQQANEDDAWEKTIQRRRETAYKTIGVEINGQEVEIPIWDEDMTPEQAEGFARDRLELGLSPFASDMEFEAAQRNNAERLDAEENAKRLTPELYPPRQYADGEDDVRPPPRRPLTKKELENEDPLIRDIIRTIPWREPHPGPQTHPREMPIFQDEGDSIRYFDPRYGSGDLELMAQKGTSNIMGMQTTSNNPGMKLFMGKIKGTRPKLLLPHPSRPRLPNAAQLDESVRTPLGIQKGSSKINKGYK